MQEDHARREHTTARLEDLWQHGVLDTPPEPEYDRLTQLAAFLTGAPVALVSLVDECRQFFKSSVGLPEPWRTRRETPLTHSFCNLVVQDHAPLVIEDARTDPRVAGNLAIADLGVLAYLGIPLTSASGTPLGSFCVIDHKPRKWTPLEIERVTQLASAVTSELRLRGLVAKQATENLPPLTADAVRLKQILINLLGNAAKFTRSGTISLTVTEVTWQEAPTLEFRVVDTGIGMEPEQLARLFQPFVQASKKIGATYGGTGLGLAISQRYARAMGGDIEAHSEPGVGSEFILRLPGFKPTLPADHPPT
jgi:signal transduction histidine kinase